MLDRLGTNCTTETCSFEDLDNSPPPHRELQERSIYYVTTDWRVVIFEYSVLIGRFVSRGTKTVF